MGRISGAAPGFRWLGGSLILLFAVFSAAGERLVLVSPHPQEVKVEFGQAFQRWYADHHGTHVTLDWRDLGGSSEIQRFVESEFRVKTNGIGIDIFFGGGPEPFLALAERQLLHAYPGASNQLVGVPAR